MMILKFFERPYAHLCSNLVPLCIIIRGLVNAIICFINEGRCEFLPTTTRLPWTHLALR